MPEYKDDTKKYHMDRVREVLILNPSASARAIRKVLEEDASDPITLHLDYILKIKKKIKGERQHRFDQIVIAERLSELQDRTEGVIAQMWKILLDGSADERARVGAAKVILDAEHSFLEAQMNAGVFERKLGTVDVRHTHALTSEHRALVIQFMRNHGVITATNPVALPQGGGRGETY